MTLRKINTSYRILKILMLLSEKPRTMGELLKELDDEVYAFTISKYFRILRGYGFIIEKRNHKFELLNMPFFVDFSDSELRALARLEIFSKDIYSLKHQEKLKISLKKIFKIMSKENFQKYNNILSELKDEKVFEQYKEKIEQISLFLEEEGVKVKLLYKNVLYTITPLELKYSGNKVYLMAFDEERLINKRFLLDDIEEIKSLSQTSLKTQFSQKTIFSLKDRVAKGYKSPYENEVIEYLDDGSILVSNSYEDKNLLFKRLLKYFEFCEIISPKADREKFIKMLDNMIENYSKSASL